MKLTSNNLQLTGNIHKQKIRSFLSIVKCQLSTVRYTGFTLVELLVYMGILTILVSILSSFFKSIVDVQLESKATSSVDQDGRFIIARLIHDFDSAQSLVTPSSAGSQTTSLQIKVSSVNYTYSLVDPVNGGSCTINCNLQISNNNGSDTLNSIDTTVSGLTFKRVGIGDNTDTVQVNFSLSSVTTRNSGAETRSYQTTLGFE